MAARTHTRTHTVYFDQEKLAAVEAAVEEMLTEWDERAEYLEGNRGYEEIVRAGNVRADLLRAAVRLAKDEAG